MRGIIDGRDVGGSGPINFRGWERPYPWVSEAPMDMDPPSPYAKSSGRRFTVKEVEDGFSELASNQHFKYELHRNFFHKPISVMHMLHLFKVAPH